MKDEASMIKYGTIINCPVTTADVYRAHRIYGADVASLKGKTRATPSHIVKLEYVPRPVQSTLNLHIDIVFIEGDPYLASVSTPLLLLMMNHLGGERTQRSLLKAINNQLDKYKGQHFAVRNILTDGEGGVITIQNALNAKGIALHPAGSGEHVCR